MGEVYRARDSRLKRDVAIKVLPDLFATDPERLARFTKEAEFLATLNHPNIAAVHGLEESIGLRAIVLELVEGDTLADASRAARSLGRGPADRNADCQGAGGGAREGDRPSRSEAGEHQASRRTGTARLSFMRSARMAAAAIACAVFRRAPGDKLLSDRLLSGRPVRRVFRFAAHHRRRELDG